MTFGRLYRHKIFLKEKGVKFVTSHKNRDKSYTQINGDIQLCQKRNQQFNWHGDFVFHPDSELTPTDEAFDEFVFDVKDVEEKYYLSEKLPNMYLLEELRISKLQQKQTWILPALYYSLCIKCIGLVLITMLHIKEE